MSDDGGCPEDANENELVANACACERGVRQVDHVVHEYGDGAGHACAGAHGREACEHEGAHAFRSEEATHQRP